MKQFHQMTGSEALQHLKTDMATGLTNQQVVERQAEHGSNEIKFKTTPLWKKVLKQFSDPMIIILMITAAVTGSMSSFFLTDLFSLITGVAVSVSHMIPDTIVILMVVGLNAIIGFIQEEKAGKAVEALKSMMIAKCLVIRDGEQVQIESTQLVPGDVLILETGDKIPADDRLLETSNFHVDESSLTGESQAVCKNVKDIADDEVVPGDRLNIAFSGTNAVQGTAKAVVVEIGGKTEFGKIAEMMVATEGNQTPLQKNGGIHNNPNQGNLDRWWNFLCMGNLPWFRS